MCGILFSKNFTTSRSAFHKALMVMDHRGPDSPGNVFEDRGTFLGHNRLSIIDVDSRSNQPFFSSDGEHCIIFNGEIYNYRELAKRFDVPMRTTSDTELLLTLYQMHGPRFLNELNGIFAFIIYNTKTKSVFAARDRLGVKPMYVYNKNGAVIISSEIAAILEKVKPEAHLDAVLELL